MYGKRGSKVAKNFRFEAEELLTKLLRFLKIWGSGGRKWSPYKKKYVTNQIALLCVTRHDVCHWMIRVTSQLRTFCHNQIKFIWTSFHVFQSVRWPYEPIYTLTHTQKQSDRKTLSHTHKSPHSDRYTFMTPRGRHSHTHKQNDQLTDTRTKSHNQGWSRKDHKP